MARFYQSGATTVIDFGLHAPTVSKKIIVFGCDASGSMAGMPWKEVQAAMAYVRDNPPMAETTETKAVVFHTYSTICTVAEAAIRKTGGSTNFLAHLRDINTCLANSNAQQAELILLTDGQPSLEDANAFPISKAEHANRTKDLTSQFHSHGCKDISITTLAFGSFVDRKYLATIRAFGSTNDKGNIDITSTQQLLETIAGLYEVSDSETRAKVIVNGIGYDATTNAENRCVIQSLLPTTSDIRVQFGDVDVVASYADATPYTRLVEMENVLEMSNNPDLDAMEKELSDYKIADQMSFVMKRVRDSIDDFRKMKLVAAERQLSTVSDEWKSLRMQARFTKARSIRKELKLRSKGLSAHQAMEKKAAAMPAYTDAELEEIAKSPIASMECGVSLNSVMDIIKDPLDMPVLGVVVVDIPMDVVLQAPEAIVLRSSTMQIFSLKAVFEAIKFCNDSGKTSDKDGFFRAADGKIPNFFLPICLGGAHATRVANMMASCLSSAFCRDAMMANNRNAIAAIALYGDMLDEKVADGEHRRILMEGVRIALQQAIPIAKSYFAAGDLSTAVSTFNTSHTARLRQIVYRTPFIRGLAAIADTDLDMEIYAEERVRIAFDYMVRHDKVKTTLSVSSILPCLFNEADHGPDKITAFLEEKGVDATGCPTVVCNIDYQNVNSATTIAPPELVELANKIGCAVTDRLVILVSFYHSDKSYGELKGDSIDDILQPLKDEAKAMFDSRVRSIVASRQLSVQARFVLVDSNNADEMTVRFGNISSRLHPLFTAVCDLLNNTDDYKQIPHVEEKLKKIMATSIFGAPWTDMPRSLRKHVQDRIKVGEWEKIIASMRTEKTYVGHVYRDGNVNRHGYGRSNPNTNLGRWIEFNGTFDDDK